MITFACPGCGKVLQAGDQYAGKTARCGQCKRLTPIPAAPAPVGPAGGDQSLTQFTPPAGAAAVGQTPGPVSDTRAEGKTYDLGGKKKTLDLDFLARPEGPGEIGRLGGYRILKILGVGGMGVVFQAEDVHLKRTVALKAMLPAAAAGTVSARERFLLEARAAAAIEHQHVVTIYQVGEDRGVPFLAMQFLRGESLEQRLKRDAKRPLPEVLRVGREVAEGLAAAHALGLIHRDIKPANVWLEAGTDRVKILDFGLAREVGEQVHLTQTGVVLGTPAYMAPEQAAGEQIDGRADLFSLGCVLYRMVTGRPAFHGSNIISTLRAVALHDPEPIGRQDGDVPFALSELVHLLLDKAPAGRPASAQAVAAALRDIERGQERTVTFSPRPAGPPPAAASEALPVAVPAEAFVPAAVAAKRAPAPAPARAVPAPPRPEPAGPGRPPSRPWLWGLVGGGLAGALLLATVLAMILLRPSPTPEPPGPPEPPPVAKGPPNPPPVVPPPVPVNAPPEQAEALRILEGHSRRVWAVAYAPDSKRALSAGTDGVIILWDLITGDVLRRFPGHGDEITGLAFLPGGRQFLSCGMDRAVRLWDANTGEALREFLGHTAGVWALALSRDGGRVAAGASDGAVFVWDVKTGRRLQRCAAPSGPVRCLAFGPDGAQVLAGAEDGSLRLWRVADGVEVRRIQAHEGTVYGAAFSPDGSQILSGSADRTLRLWNAATGAPLRQFFGHTNEVNGVAFTPDGRRALSASDDLTVRLWDVASARELRRFVGHRRLVFAVAVAPDGRTALSGAFDNSVRLWSLGGLARP
jgi:hypothetical protein